MRQPHLHDRVNQEAAWQAVVKVSGVDFSFVKPASPSREGALTALAKTGKYKEL